MLTMMCCPSASYFCTCSTRRHSLHLLEHRLSVGRTHRTSAVVVVCCCCSALLVLYNWRASCVQIGAVTCRPCQPSLAGSNDMRSFVDAPKVQPYLE
jgi:hypothetical protein